jgi:hypothetical protein
MTVETINPLQLKTNMALSKRTPEREKAFLDGLRTGLTREASASRVDVDRTQIWRWIERFATFRNAVTRAEAEAEARFTSTMAQAAAPHEVVETTTTQGPDGTVTKTVIRREFDWRAAESWLKRRRRADWGDSLDVKRIDDDTLLRLIASAAGSVPEEPATSVTVKSETAGT